MPCVFPRLIPCVLLNLAVVLSVNLRYHHGVHLCALWPRARVKSLTRTLSGCGSCDLPQSSPVSTRSRRGSSGSCFTPSDRGAHDHAEGTDSSHPHHVRLHANGSANTTPASGTRGGGGGGDGGGTRGETTVAGNGNSFGVDETAISVTVLGGETTASTGGGTPNGAPNVGLGRADFNPEEPEWGQNNGFSGADSPSHGGGGGGGVFWPGAGGSPGLLRVAAEGEEDGRCSGSRMVRNSKSSLGSGSLASVICESPSEVSDGVSEPSLSDNVFWQYIFVWCAVWCCDHVARWDAVV